MNTHRTGSDPPDPLRVWLRAIGLLGFVCALGFLWARFLAFEPMLEVTGRLLSPDGVVTAAGRGRLASILIGGAICAVACGIFALALADRRWRAKLDAAIRWDPLRESGLATPNAYWMLTLSAGLGLLLIAFWTWHVRLRGIGEFLVAKEGPLEDATFILDLIAAWLCAMAAWRWRRAATALPRAIPMLYGLCALALFIVGMEEINWGQTLLGFGTPPSWTAINHQHETSVHNLLDRDTLTVASKVLAVAFAGAVLMLVLWSVAIPRSVIGATAPHSSLAPLALMIGYSGVYLHPEAIELLLAVFFTFYCSRIYAATRSTTATARALPLRKVHTPVEPDVPLLHGSEKASWDTELLEYTHDAIIIWEMNGAGILYWNRAAEHLYGYSRQEAHRRITHELLKTRLAGGVTHLETMVARYGIWIGELRHTTRDGRQVQVEARLALMSQQNGRWLVLEVNRDITDRKAAEAHRAAIERQLAEMRGLHSGPL